MQNEIPQSSNIQSLVQGTALINESEQALSSEHTPQQDTIVVSEQVPVYTEEAVKKQIGTERVQVPVTEMKWVDTVVATETQHVQRQVPEVEEILIFTRYKSTNLIKISFNFKFLVLF